MKFEATVRTVVIATALALYGCGGDGGTVTGGNGPPVDTDNPAALSAGNADEAIRKSLLDFYTNPNNRSGEGGGIGTDAIAFPESVESANADASAGSDDSGLREFSDTNVQEQGVDEADRVKIDGDVMFALEQPDFNYLDYGRPIPVDATIDIVSDSLPVYDPVYETLSAYRLDGDNSSVLSRFSLEPLGSRYITGMYLHNKDLILMTGPSFSPWDVWRDTSYWGGGNTQISWINASDPTSMSVKRTIDIQGHLISSRRVGDKLILVTRYIPMIEGINPVPFNDVEIQNNRDAITNADATEFLPQLNISENGTTTSRSVMGDDSLCYSANNADTQSSGGDEDIAGTSLYYPSPNVLSIITIDLNSLDSSLNSTCFIGDSETMYVSTQSIYLATTRYNYGIAAQETSVVAPDIAVDFPADIDVVWYQPDITTEVHKFSINPTGAPQFKGSGSVKGHLGWNPKRKPYRMSEKDGYLRILTYDESRNGSPVTLNILQESNGALGTVSTLPNDSRPEPIGKVGESLYASRFIGDKAYLVTFRVTDPLYVLDVSNPNDPRVEGELEIPGYSDYLHPVNDSLLIGLGKDAVPATNVWGDGRGAWYTGVKLALYDVADPSNPFVADERIIGKRYTESPALSQPHSFAYLAGDGNRNARFAFPIQLHDQPNTLAPPNGSDWTSNNLLKMEVDEDSRKFVEIPRWEFETRSSGFQWSPIGLENDRAVIGGAGDLYYIHNGSLHFGQWGSSEPTATFSQ